jgi:hypothetical protein
VTPTLIYRFGSGTDTARTVLERDHPLMQNQRTEVEMSSWPEPASLHDARPKTMKFCKVCQRDTAHEIRSGAGMTATICVACLQRALCYELDRE